MATPISDFRDGIRVLIGDVHADAYMFEDAAVDSAVKLLIRSGSPFEAYSLTNGNAEITPDVSNPNAFGLVMLKAARAMLTPHSARMSVRQPGLSVVTGGHRETLYILTDDAYEKEMEMEEADVFKTYQDLYTWLAAHTGSDYFWGKMRVDEEIPINDLSVGSGGISLG